VAQTSILQHHYLTAFKQMDYFLAEADIPQHFGIDKNSGNGFATTAKTVASAKTHHWSLARYPVSQH
jgi:hypothetical protein